MCVLMSKCEYYDKEKGICNNAKNPGNVSGRGTKSGVVSNICRSYADRCMINGGKPHGKCGYYDKEKGICNNPENPGNVSGRGTKSGVASNICGSYADRCMINGGKPHGKCGYYDKEKGMCNNPENPGNVSGRGTKSGVASNICGSYADRCMINGGKPHGKCGYYDKEKGICNNPENPGNVSGRGTKSGVASNICGSYADRCMINGGKPHGKCGYYDKEKGICNNPENPGNVSGRGTKSGVASNICGSYADRCMINGGKPHGKCGYYDKENKKCNNPNKLNSENIIKSDICNSHAEKCEINFKKVNIKSNFMRICPYCKKKISTIAIKRGRCSECGKYL